MNWLQPILAGVWEALVVHSARDYTRDQTPPSHSLWAGLPAERPSRRNSHVCPQILKSHVGSLASSQPPSASLPAELRVSCSGGRHSYLWPSDPDSSPFQLQSRAHLLAQVCTHRGPILSSSPCHHGQSPEHPGIRWTRSPSVSPEPGLQTSTWAVEPATGLGLSSSPS